MRSIVSVSSRKVIDLWNPLSWRECEEPVVEHLGSEVLQKLEDTDPAEMHFDSLRFLSRVSDQSQDELEELGRSLLGEFQYLRCFHATRPFSVRKLVLEGLRALDRDLLLSLVFERMPTVTESEAVEVKEVCREMPLDRDDCDVCFATCTSVIQSQNAGHYLFSGPEILFSVVEEMRRRGFQKAAGKLSDGARIIGVPTILECYVPIEWLSNTWVGPLARCLLTEVVRHLVHPSFKEENRDFTVKLESDLPPGLIVSHEHPAVLFDPERYNVALKNPNRTCDACNVSEV